MQDIERLSNSLLYLAFPAALIAGMHDLVGTLSFAAYLFVALVLAAYFCRSCYEHVFRGRRAAGPFVVAAILLGALALIWVRDGETLAPIFFGIAYLIWLNVARSMAAPSDPDAAR